MSRISPLASIDPRAQIADGVEIGPFCVVGPEVKIGEGCRLLSHVVIAGDTTVGRDNVFHPNAVVGGIPQDKKYRNDPTRLEMGDRNQIRESVTINLGTVTGGNITRLGNDNLIMANCHVGHDAIIGNGAIIANNVMLGGHVVCGDHVHLMGGAGVQPFVSIGDFAYVGGRARVRHDVPPFVKVDDDRIRGLNAIGLRRCGISETDIEALEQAYRRLFTRRQPFSRAMAEFDAANDLNPYVQQLVEFLRRRDLGVSGRYLESQRKDVV